MQISPINYSPHYQRSRAVVVGINSYIDSTLETLGNAEEDAYLVASILRSLEMPFEVKLLLGEQASREAVLNQLYDLRSSGHDDRGLFYFAGHGFTVADKFGGENGFLAVHDTMPDMEFSAISLGEVTDLRRFSPAKHIGFIFDSCFSGQALGLTRTSKVAADKFLSRRAYQVISAGAGDQTVSDYQSMTSKLVAAIEQRETETSGLITFNGLGLYLQQTIAADFGKTQIPQVGHLSGSQGGDLIISASKHYWSVDPIESKPSIELVMPLTSSIPANGIYKADVDLSGRIENLQAPTVLSISAGLSFSLLISGSEKQITLNALADKNQNWGKTRLNVYLYTILLYLLIREHIVKLDLIIIDPEYKGYEPEIKNTILTLCRNSGIKVDRKQITFIKSERKSPARIMSSRVYKGSSDPDWVVSADEILSIVS